MKCLTDTRHNFTILVALFLLSNAGAQPFAPAAGQAGTTAMHKDSSAFVNWASACTVLRGHMDISNKSLGPATSGNSSNATGKATGADVVSLGDGGSATCTFQYPVRNLPGPDFAVFENAFNDTFLELAFVEVSSNGNDYFRFPARSLTDTLTQTDSFGSVDATKVNNLAGKYRAGFGTPFDLSDLPDDARLDKNAITHIKIIDVVGSVNAAYATRDSQNNKINDPWPTPFESSGFDLDAIGVIHQAAPTGLNAILAADDGVSVFPNPGSVHEDIYAKSNLPIENLVLTDCFGKVILQQHTPVIPTTHLQPGLYYLQIKTSNGTSQKKILLGH